MNVILHRLADGRWRVTDAPDDWRDDGRDPPPPNDTDAVFEGQAEAIRDYLERTAAPDPEDDIADEGFDRPLD